MIYNADYLLENVKKDTRLIFLAGSIDLELEGNWRESAAAKLGDAFNYFDPTTLNYETLNDEGWVAHIEWELLAMEMSDVILINFLPEAKSPISLIELGLNTHGKKLVVSCPKAFYKSQYINVLCKHYRIPIFDDLSGAIAHIDAI